MAEISEDTLEALYAINRAAKRYASNASDAYEARLKADARLYSIKKETLYRYKTRLLEQWYRDGQIDRVERHRIDGREYYCLSVDGWSFHCPVGQWSVGGIESSVAETKAIPEFDSTTGRDGEETLSERDALQHLADQFTSANEFLVQPFVERSCSSSFAGWSYLPGAIEKGGVVTEQEFHQEYRPDFLFAVGDRFETLEYGEIEIVDRYGKWLEPRWRSGPVVPREVYDVAIDGEVLEGVRQERIHEDWQVRIRDPVEPCSQLDGSLGELVGTEYDGDPEFREGDIVVLDPAYRDEDPREYRIGRMTASWSLVTCELRPVDENDWEEWLAIEEFVDDVVAVESAGG